MKRLLLLLMFLLMPSLASAKSCQVAYYGIQHPGWPCDASIQALSQCTDIKVAFLAHTFGDETQCLGKLLADPRVSAVEIHLINERCEERPGGCGSYEFMFGLPMKQFNSLLKVRDPGIMHKTGLFFTQLAGQFIPLLQPNTVCWVSPVLESKVEPSAFAVLAEIAHWQFLQRCHIVDNPLQFRGSPYIIELHGNKPRINPPCIADLDGTDIKLDLVNNANEKGRQFYSGMISESAAIQYTQEYAKCGAAYLWVHEFNGRSKNFNDPRARFNWPTPEIFNRVIALAPGQPAPTPTPPPSSGTGPAGTEKSFSNGMLWKPVADSGGNAVFLLPSSYCDASKAGMRVQMVDRLGYHIENSKFTGCANGNRPTHRYSRTAIQLTPSAPLYLIWQFNGGQEWVKVANPTQRYE